MRIVLISVAFLFLAKSTLIADDIPYLSMVNSPVLGTNRATTTAQSTTTISTDELNIVTPNYTVDQLLTSQNLGTLIIQSGTNADEQSVANVVAGINLNNLTEKKWLKAHATSRCTWQVYDPEDYGRTTGSCDFLLDFECLGDFDYADITYSLEIYIDDDLVGQLAFYGEDCYLEGNGTNLPLSTFVGSLVKSEGLTIPPDNCVINIGGLIDLVDVEIGRKISIDTKVSVLPMQHPSAMGILEYNVALDGLNIN